jgi:restriction endonuclease S subunit
MTLLKDIVQIEKGKKHNLLEENKQGAIRVFQANDFRNENKPLYTLDADGVFADEDDILLVWDGSVGQMGYGRSGYVGSTMVKLKVRNKSKFSSFFLYKFLQTQTEYLKRKATGATILHINRKSLEQLEVPDFDLDDQFYIANILSKVENLIARRNESITLLDRFLKSTFGEMFGNPVTNVRKFKIVRLKELMIFLTSGGRGWNQYYSAAGGRFIRSFDVQMNYISNVDAVYVNPPKNQETKRTQVHPNDILLTITGSKIGRVALIPLDFGIGYVSQHVAIVRVKNINPLFLSYYLADDNCGQQIIRKNQYGQTKPGLNFKQIENFGIINPPMALQDRFAQIVQKVEALKTQFQYSLLELENLYTSLNKRAFNAELLADSQTLIIHEQKPNEVEEKYFLKRKVLATHIINQSLTDSQFGDVKFEKILHLSDYYIIKRNLNQNYLQKAAGPYDNAFTIPFFKQIEVSKWFTRNKKGAQYVFKPGSKHKSSFNTYGYFSDEEIKGVNKLIAYFRKSDYEQPEIISTLYAVWNNRIIRQQLITDELLKEDFLKWDAQKIKYKDRLDAALNWMRKEGIVPDGWGKLIEKPKSKKLKNDKSTGRKRG